MKVKALLITFLFAGFFLNLGYSQPSPETLKNKAFAKIEVANGLLTRAQDILKTDPNSKENLIAAIQLFIEAGQIFEETANTLESLGPEYANPQDIAGARTMVNQCVETIKQCRQRLYQLE